MLSLFFTRLIKGRLNDSQQFHLDTPSVCPFSVSYGFYKTCRFNAGVEEKSMKKNVLGSNSGRANFPVILFACLVVLSAALWGWLAQRPQPLRIDTSTVVQDIVFPVTPDTQSKQPLRVVIAAMISPERTAQSYSRLIQLVGEKIGRPVEITQRKTYAEANSLVENREVDFALICSGAYVEGHDKFGMEILAVPVAHGRKVYYSYILAQKDSAVANFDELRGKRFAFTDPKSNTGALVPRYMLAQRHETPESFFADSFFTYSHDNSIHAVAEGITDGAAVDSLIWDYLHVTDATDTGRTRIVEKSPPYGIPPVVVHPAVDAGMKSLLRSAFFALHTEPKAIPLLQELQIDRFEAGEDSMYDSVRQMQRWIIDNPLANK